MRRGGDSMEKSLTDLIDGGTRIYMIVGHPIAQVMSPAKMTRAFRERAHNAVLVPMHVVPDGLDVFFSGIAGARNVDGMVVTMPHKMAAYGYCATASERAHFLKAVNVLRRAPDGAWHGDMLDGLGYIAALAAAGCPVRNRDVLVVGAGGAGSAIAQAMVMSGASRLAVHDENPQRRDTLIRVLGAQAGSPVEAGSMDPRGFDIVVNATPLGMKPDDPYPVMIEHLSPSVFVGDVITAPVVSPLLRSARDLGCATLTGAQMYDGVCDLMTDFFLVGT